METWFQFFKKMFYDDLENVYLNSVHYDIDSIGFDLHTGQRLLPAKLVLRDINLKPTNIEQARGGCTRYNFNKDDYSPYIWQTLSVATTDPELIVSSTSLWRSRKNITLPFIHWELETC